MTQDDDFLTGRIARIPAPDHAADWERLTTQARIAMTRAYVPYSDYPVGAAALLEDGTIISGCNVENASYGLTLCAECTMIGALQMAGGGKIVAFTCVNRQGEYITPCGRCRQLLLEFSAPTMHVRTARGTTTLDALLPESFGPRDLETNDLEMR
ncbi:MULTISPECIES: cytidine deaminase [Nesterenkonia]|uniref:Cytidine deaminase n=1 Tax=Nesterenkonia aurantiaca TaxID=1436010 RepID=A0A4V3ECH3_9MICC|nr:MULTISPECIES: cytidine deaminase [Nesterenkonia]TDS86424.1 cytidine deaminase [Nesterenkonia aurantiaca]